MIFNRYTSTNHTNTTTHCCQQICNDKHIKHLAQFSPPSLFSLLIT
jgi:hypothetical protein